MKRMYMVLPLAIVLAALGIGCSLLMGPALAQEKGKDKVVPRAGKWEYKVLTTAVVGTRIDTQKLEETLNQLGEDGWECSGTLSEVHGGVPAAGGTSTRGFVIMKRRKQ